MNKTNVRTVAVLALSTLALAACGGGSEDTPSEGAGAVALPASVKGVDLQRCDALDSSSGSALNGKTVVKNLRLGTDGTYTYNVRYSDGTGCVGQAGSATGAGQTSDGSEDVFRYNQSGTYVASSMASDGSYDITFTITGNSFTSRTGTMGVAMKDAVNTNCTMSLSGGGQQNVPTNATCLSTVSTYIVPTPPVASLVMKQRLEISGRGISIGSFSNIYTPGFVGNSTAPTSVSVGLYTY